MKIKKSKCIVLFFTVGLAINRSRLQAQQQELKLKRGTTMNLNEEKKSKKESQISYFLLNLQKQHEVSPQKFFATACKEYYNEQLKVCIETSRGLRSGKFDFSGETLTPSVKSLNHLFDENVSVSDGGYTVLAGVLMPVYRRVEFSCYITEMFKWRFRWHTLENMRNSIGLLHAHVSVEVEDSERLVNEKLLFMVNVRQLRVA